MLRITVTPEEGTPRTVEIEQVPFVIGREADCDLVLEDARVSRHHAQVEVLDDGRVVLRDLGSANGTFVEDSRIEGGVWFDVPGSFRVGRTAMRLETDARSDETMPIGRLDARMAAPTAQAGPAPGAPAMAEAPAATAMAARPAAPAYQPGPAWPDRPANAPPAWAAGVEPIARPPQVRWAQVALIAAGAITVLIEGLSIALLMNDELDLGDAAGPLIALSALSVVFGAAQVVGALMLGRPTRRAWTIGITLAGVGTGIAGLLMLLAVLSGLSPGLGIARLVANALAVSYLRQTRDWYRG